MNTENETKTPDSSGSIKFHESVLASIIRKAVASVPDVVRLSGSSFIDNIAEMVNSRKTFDRSILIEMDGNTASVEVRIVVKYGVSIPAAASAVRSAVTSDLVRMTGMKVARVNVVVMDVDDESATEGENEAEE